MANISNRAIMTLYSDPECPFCHRIRIALAEKNVEVKLETIRNGHWPEDVAAANPYGNTPTLIDNNLVLFNTNIILEYLNERFVHPALLPQSPAERAQMKQMLYRIDRDWFSLWKTINGKESAKTLAARKTIQEDLTVLSPLFAQSTYFMSDEFSVLDCAMAPLLWRLPALNITLPPKASVVEDYADRLFSRPSFQASLSTIERKMR